MRSMKKFVVAGITVLTLIAGSVTAYAASQYGSPAEAVAGLSGREVQSVIDERAQTGKTYGTIANEADVLDEFKAEMLEMKKDKLAARVAAGMMTQQQADDIIARIVENQANCDGTQMGFGQNGTGCKAGAGYGKSNGQGFRQNGRGMGNGLHDGSCLSDSTK